VLSACVAAVKCRPVLHHCVVIFFWSSGTIDCLFIFEKWSSAHARGTWACCLWIVCTKKWHVNMYVFVTIISTLTLKTIKKPFIMKMKHFIDKYKYEWLKRSLFPSLLGRWCYWCMSCKTFFDLLQWRILSKMIIGIQKNIRITIAIINLKVSPIFHLGSLDSEPKMLPITLRYLVHGSNTNSDINVLTDRNTIRTWQKMYVGSTVFASFGTYICYLLVYLSVSFGAAV